MATEGRSAIQLSGAEAGNEGVVHIRGGCLRSGYTLCCCNTAPNEQIATTMHVFENGSENSYSGDPSGVGWPATTIEF